MPHYDLTTLVRISIPARDGGPPRRHPRAPHPNSLVLEAKGLVQTTTLPLRSIARRININNGTLSRWVHRHGWTRPPGAPKPCPRPERRYVTAPGSLELAQRLRVQAERLLQTIESAPTVDPAALAEAQRLLAQARAEQASRRPKKRVPPPPPSPAEATERDRQKRAAAALKGWTRRYARQHQQRAWLYQKLDD